MSPKKRGKKPTIDHRKFEELLLEHKNELVESNKILTPAASTAWKTLGNSLGLSADTLYSYVVGTRFPHYRSLLTGQNHNVSIDNSISSLDNSASADITKFNYEGEYQIRLTKTAFERLVQEKTVKSGKTGNKQMTKVRTILQEKEWEETIAEKLWTVHKIVHGFHFSTHNLTRDASSGRILGSCSCGGTIDISIDNQSDEWNAIFDCHIVKGTGTCKPRQLRGDKRLDIAKHLEDKSIDLYVTEERRRLQDHGDPNPPILPSKEVLRTAKHEQVKSHYMHKDPTQALKISKNSPNGADWIRDIGCDPFYVFIFSGHQLRLYNKFSDQCPLILDSTSGIARKVDILENRKSRTLCLHLGVINCEKGQFAVFASITERQDTISIGLLLKRFFQAGANFPLQVVTDEGRALQTAVIDSCTNYLSIEDYCDGFYENPEKMADVTLVSIDVNHYMKTWSRFFKSIQVTKHVKTFYMASIGQLVLSNSLKDAQELIELLFTVSLSLQDGTLENVAEFASTDELRYEKLLQERPALTSAEKANKILTAKITGQENVYEKLGEQSSDDSADGSSDESSDSSDDKISTNIRSVKRSKKQKNGKKKANARVTLWEQWGLKVKENVKKKIDCEKGSHTNAYYNPDIANRLNKQIRHLPMFTNIHNKKFAVTNVKPSTSASVECEIKLVKHNALGGKGKVTRIDRTVGKIIKYYDGKLRAVGPDDSNNSVHSPRADSEVRSPGITDADEHDKNNMDMNDLYSDSSDEMEQRNETHTTQESRPNDNVSQTSNIDCVACRNGDAPEGAHRCSVCSCKVHALPGCSFELPGDLDSEGYGQKRICKSCNSQSDINKRVSINNSKITKDCTKDMNSSTVESPRTRKPLRNISNVDKNCKVCSGVGVATHKCHLCMCFIHNLPSCSEPMHVESDDEAYKKLLVCKPCLSKKNVAAHVALNEIENHKGHPIKDLIKDNKSNRRQNLYLGGSADKIRDVLLLGENCKTMKSLPMIKKGSDTGLALININGVLLSLELTCAIDSVFHITLVGCSDYPFFYENLALELESDKVKSKKKGKVQKNDKAKDNSENTVDSRKLLLQMVCKAISTGGITSDTYKNRALIMANFKNIQLVNEKQIQCIDCSCELGELLAHLFKNRSSMSILKSCSGNCEPYLHTLDTVMIHASIAKNKKTLESCLKKFSDIEICDTPGCNNVLHNTVTVETFICLELYGFVKTTSEMMLSKVPKTIEIDNNMYVLLGIIQYEGNDLPVSGKEIGHYSAVCLRGMNYVKYDTQEGKPQPIPEKSKLKPKALFYIKKNMN